MVKSMDDNALSRLRAASANSIRNTLSSISIPAGVDTNLTSSAVVDGVGVRGYLLTRLDIPSYHKMKRHYYRMIGIMFLRFANNSTGFDLSTAVMEAEVVKFEFWDGKGLFHRYKNAFKLHTSIGVYNIEADTEEDYRIWVDYATKALAANEVAQRELKMKQDQFGALFELSDAGTELKDGKEKPPSFKNHSHCMHSNCTVKFQSTRRRQHHCRNCGNTICSEHAAQFTPLLHIGYSKAERVCVSCVRVQRFLQLQRNVNQMYVVQRMGNTNDAHKPTDDSDVIEKLKRTTLDPDFGVSDAVHELQLHKNSGDVAYTLIIEKLIEMSSSSMEDFEFFLPQLFHIWATFDLTTNITKCALLVQVLMTAARKHIRLAQLIYWNTKAAIDDSFGRGFGQTERTALPSRVRKFPMYKLLMINLEVLIAGKDWKFQVDEDLKATPIQAAMIQCLFNRISALQDVDAQRSRRRSDTLGSICTAMMACGVPWSVKSSKLPGDDTYNMKKVPKNHLYLFFQSQIAFMSDICNVAEQLRFVQPPTDRKKYLHVELGQLQLPRLSFFPLGSCNTKLAKIVNIPIAEGTVFSTRERAPTLIYFEIQRASTDLDENLWHRQVSMAVSSHSQLKAKGDVVDNELQTIILNELSGNSADSDESDLEMELSLFDGCFESEDDVTAPKRRTTLVSTDAKPASNVDHIIDACSTYSIDGRSPRRSGARDVEGISNHELVAIAREMSKYALHKSSTGIASKKIFTGKDAVLWMTNNAAALNVPHALWLGQEMMKAGILQSEGKDSFENSAAFYDIVLTDSTEANRHLDLPPMMPISTPTSINRSHSSSHLRLASRLISPSHGFGKLRCISDDTESMRSNLEAPKSSVLDRFDPDTVMDTLSTIDNTVQQVKEAQLRETISSGLLELRSQLVSICDYVSSKKQRQKKAIASVFGEKYDAKISRIKNCSPHGHIPGWDCLPMIVKSHDDLRQEVFCLQLIRQFQDIFDTAELSLRLLPYNIIATSASSGFIEVVQDACSLDALKKQSNYTTLSGHFNKTYGGEDSLVFQQAMRCYVWSMAAYSLVCYILQIKDRHNGNIMIDSSGHIVHIDFGFMLGIAPGGSFSLEKAPFKLTEEMVNAMGGNDSKYFKEYVVLMIHGFIALQEHANTILMMVAIMSQQSMFPCFANRDPRIILERMRDRFKLGCDRDEVVSHVVRLIRKSQNSYRTRQYDKFQKMTNGIAP